MSPTTSATYTIVISAILVLAVAAYGNDVNNGELSEMPSCKASGAAAQAGEPDLSDATSLIQASSLLNEQRIASHHEELAKALATAAKYKTQVEDLHNEKEALELQNQNLKEMLQQMKGELEKVMEVAEKCKDEVSEGESQSSSPHEAVEKNQADVEDQKEAKKEENKEVTPTHQEEPKQEEKEATLSNGNLKDCERVKGNVGQVLCTAACQPWPTAKGSQTGKKGCDTSAKAKGFSNAAKYCKNVCEPSKGCQTQQGLITVSDPNKPCPKPK